MKMRALILLLALSGPSQSLPQTRFDGYWLGTLTARARELRLLLHVTPGDPPTVMFTSLDQDGVERPATEVRVTGASISFRSGSAVVRGELAGGTLNATFEQAGASFPISFSRVDGPPVVMRPQEPVPPFPYLIEEVSIPSTDGVVLAGTLTRPAGDGPHPAVLLISGSGPQDRNQQIFSHKPFLVIADHLTRRGIAVLRVDDRGAGASTGSRALATVDDYAADALAGVRFLAARAGIDRARIGLLGHSEGGIVAPLVAGRTRDVAFMVLIAAPAMDGVSLAMLQAERIARAAGASPDQLALQQALNRRIFEILMRETDETATRAAVRAAVAEELAAIGVMSQDVVSTVEKQMEPQLRRGLSPWFRHFLSYDPLPALRAITIPTLALYGSLDVQVPAAENAPLMRAALAARSAASDVRTLAGLNHLFQTAQTGAMDEYGRIEETFAPAALDAIAAWLQRVTAK